MKTLIDPSASITSELLLIENDGTQVPLSIRIGLPFQANTLWRCACEIRGLEDQYPDIAGGDAIQAMSLALKFVRVKLAAHIASGRMLCLPNDKTRPISVEFLDTWFVRS